MENISKQARCAVRNLILPIINIFTLTNKCSFNTLTRINHQSARLQGLGIRQRHLPVRPGGPQARRFNTTVQTVRRSPRWRPWARPAQSSKICRPRSSSCQLRGMSSTAIRTHSTACRRSKRSKGRFGSTTPGGSINIVHFLPSPVASYAAGLLRHDFFDDLCDRRDQCRGPELPH
jgi:hypothetical protein